MPDGRVRTVRAWAAEKKEKKKKKKRERAVSEGTGAILGGREVLPQQ